jgi:SAM-dependent methyltransferase
VPVYFAPWAERLVEVAGVRPGDRVLDVACGTGIVARRAAASVGAGGVVVGVDVNDAMLKVAAATAEGVRPVIQWQQADAAGRTRDTGQDVPSKSHLGRPDPDIWHTPSAAFALLVRAGPRRQFDRARACE